MPAPLPHGRSSITARSILLGLCGVTLICTLTPYNDYALNNTYLIGNNFPLAVVMLLFLFTLCINGPLSRWWPDRAFTAAEITVAFSMTLVSCALPSSGLMRYFPPSLIVPFKTLQTYKQWMDLYQTFHIPRWLYPTFTGNSPADWMTDPIVTDYTGRWTQSSPIPYAAWITPALSWGIFFAALFTCLICLMVIVRKQWVENERLAFPLAQIYLSLLEPPERGKLLNSTFARPWFWLAFFAVFGLHLWNGFARYHPKIFPEIWNYYHQPQLFSEPPWSYVHYKMMDAAIFFTVVGVSYFMPTSIAFSMWFFFLFRQAQRMWLGSFTGDPEVYGQHDQHFGGLIAYFLAAVWIGRKHWAMVLRQMGAPFGRVKREDVKRDEEGSFAQSAATIPTRHVSRFTFQESYLSYRTAGYLTLISILVMIAWLTAAGASVLASTVSVLLLLFLFIIITKFIAETGLLYGQLQVPIYYPWQLLVRAGFSYPISTQSYYITSFLQCQHYDFREIVPVYASHSLYLADKTLTTDNGPRATDNQRKKLFLMLLALSLVFGYFLSLASTLWTEYHYAWTQDISARLPINDWGVENPNGAIVGSTLQYNRQNFPQPHSSALHLSIGFAVTSALSFLRLRFTAFPLHPIGYLMLDTYPGDHLWFSFFWGWLAKILIVRFTGPRGYLAARPFFIGLIVGESMAAGFWLVTSIAMSTFGIPYRPVNVMPG